MKRVIIMLALVLAVPAFAFAAGGHDMLSCTGCHSIHEAKTGELIFAVEPNKQEKGMGVSSLCLGCHSNKGGMGIRPVASTHSHPWSVTPNPKVANVPQQALRGGKLECVGCHDPHPSNANFRYLRVDTNNGANMQNFCALCHSSKAGKRTPASQIFSSMDESAFSAKPAPKPAAKPATKK